MSASAGKRNAAVTPWRLTSSNASDVSSTTIAGSPSCVDAAAVSTEAGQCEEIDVGAARFVSRRDTRGDVSTEGAGKVGGVGQLVCKIGHRSSTDDRALDGLVRHEHRCGDTSVLFTAQFRAVVEHRDRRSHQQHDAADERAEADQSHERSSAGHDPNLRKY